MRAINIRINVIPQDGTGWQLGATRPQKPEAYPYSFCSAGRHSLGFPVCCAHLCSTVQIRQHGKGSHPPPAGTACLAPPTHRGAGLGRGPGPSEATSGGSQGRGSVRQNPPGSQISEDPRLRTKASWVKALLSIMLGWTDTIPVCNPPPTCPATHLTRTAFLVSPRMGSRRTQDKSHAWQTLGMRHGPALCQAPCMY